jgi:6-phosphogluconate dehydrogenase
VQRLSPPRAVWVMVPAGAITDKVVGQLGELLERGDAVIDGGNSLFKDDIRRARTLADRGIDYLDVGTSGGVWGLERGYCLMIGGPRPAFDRLEPIFATLAPGVGDVPRTPGRTGEPSAAERGYLYCGSTGAGHFVKMIHNGIEYGIMQAYAEGFDILAGAASETLPPERRLQLELPEIAEVWRRGSVVGSWLLDLTAQALVEDPELARYSGHVADSGEGRWTIDAAVEQGTPANVLAASLFARFRSRQDATFGDKMLSAMRAKFGGHQEPK